MLEMPQQSNLIAAAVVILGLVILGFFVREGVATSKLYQKGVAFYQEQDYQGAETTFRNVLSRHPSNDMVHLLLGDALMQQDKLEEAIAQFQELTHRAPKNVDAFLRLGNALVKQNKLEEAVTVLEKTSQLLKAQRQNQKAEQVDQLLQQLSAPQSLT